MKKLIIISAALAILSSCGLLSKCDVTHAYAPKGDGHNIELCLKCDSLTATDFKKVEKAAYKK